MPFDSMPRITPAPSVIFLPGMKGAGRREDRAHAGSRIGRAADHLDRRACADIDRADAQAIRIGMLHRLDHARDREAGKLRGRVVYALDLKPDTGERLDDLGKRCIGLKVVLEPGEGEFHEDKRPRELARASAA